MLFNIAFPKAKEPTEYSSEEKFIYQIEFLMWPTGYIHNNLPRAHSPKIFHVYKFLSQIPNVCIPL